ncbi:MAG: hypothetical protein ABEK17_01335, partial [Candidatus Aenigmatarchaeota archaeon]
SLIRIGKVLILNVSAESLNWGNQDPNQKDIIPQSPSMPIQIGINENSNDADGIYLKSSGLSGNNPSDVIGPSNISWDTGASRQTNLNNLSDYWQELRPGASSIDCGTVYDTEFWLDTPPTYPGSYSGSIMIMANTSW